MKPYYRTVIMKSIPEFKWPEEKYAEVKPQHRNDTGGTKLAAPTISLSVSRNQLSQPMIFGIGIVSGIAVLLLAYKFYPQIFKYFKPKAQ